MENKINQPTVWTRDFLFICLTNFLIFLGYYLLLPTLPIFVKDILHRQESDVGYVIGILALMSVLMRPLAGYLIDRFGRSKILLAGLLAITICMSLYNFIASFIFLLILRLLHGVSWAFATTGAGTVASDIVPAEKRGEGLGYYGLTTTLAMAIGPWLAIFIIKTFSFQWLFHASTVISILALLSILGISFQASKRSTKPEKFDIKKIFEPTVIKISVIMFFFSFVYGSIISFIILYAKEIKIINPGTFFLVYAATLLVVRPWAGKRFDTRGPLKVIAPGFIATMISFFLLYSAHGRPLFFAAGILLGIGFGIIHPTVMAMAINSVLPQNRGAANGTVLSSFDLGIALGSVSLGYLAEMTSLRTMYLATAFISLIPMFYFYFIIAKNYRKVIK